MFNLSNIGPRVNSKKNRKRVGRGAASGWGKTAGRGSKGQKARSGVSIPRGFEGGQLPMYRRLPKRGFQNPFRKTYAIINLADLQDAKSGDVINQEWLASKGLIPKNVGDGVKVLGHGEISVGVTIAVNKISQSAQAKIEAAGGKVELV